MKKKNLQISGAAAAGGLLGDILPPPAFVPLFLVTFLGIIALAWAIASDSGGVSFKPRPALFILGPLKPLTTIKPSKLVDMLSWFVAFIFGFAAGVFIPIYWL